MRKRNGRKTRSTMLLDLRKLYLGGFTPDLFQPIDVAFPEYPEFEIEFCQGILKTDASHFEAMVLLGDAYSRKGEFQKGLDLDLKLSRIKPDNELIRYNLACSYALTGQKEKAIRCLSKAVELGYKDVEHLSKDKDFEIIKGDPRFQTIIKQLEEEQAQPH